MEPLPDPRCSPLEAGLRYIRRGWAVIPICAPDEVHGCTARRAGMDHPQCAPGVLDSKAGKVPIAAWKARTTTTEREARKWWDRAAPAGPNIALLCGPARILVLDIDGAAGEATLAALVATLGPLPATLEQTTSRGRHLVFVAPQEATEADMAVIKGSIAAWRGPGLDLRAGAPSKPGGYIVLAPSKHLSGAVYAWRDHTHDPAALPLAWWHALPREEARVREGGAPSSRRLQSYLGGTLARLVADLRDAPEGARNTTLRDTTTRAMRLGLAAGENLDQIAEQIAAAARSAGLPPSEIAVTMENARHYAEAQGPAAPPAERARPAPARPAPPPEQLAEQLADDDRVPILSGPDLHRVVDDAQSALARCANVYQRHGLGLCRIVFAPERPEDEDEPARNLAPPPGAVMVEQLPLPTLAEWLSSVARFEAQTKSGALRPIKPPLDVIASLSARRSYPPTIRPLFGVITAPALRHNGTVITAPGYDRPTGLFLQWDGAPLDLPASPTKADAARAFEQLAEPFCDFAFQGDAAARRVALAAIVSAILTPIARPAIDGPVPMVMLEADQPNAGKSLVAAVCGTIATGRAPATRQYTEDDDEMAKRLAAIAISGVSVMLLDNVRAHIEGGALEQVLTATDTIAARILGTSTDRELPWRTSVIATANAATYSRDVSRRLLHVSMRGRGLVVGGERAFRYPDLLDHVRGHRRELLTAALVILRAHHAAGRPRAGSTLDSFEAWSRIVGGAVAWASGADPVRARPPESTDRDGDTARRVALAWWSAFGEDKLALREARDRSIAASTERPGVAGPTKVEGLADLSAALADLAGASKLDRVELRSLGRRFEQLVADRQFQQRGGGILEIQRVGENRNGSALYRAQLLTPPPSTDEVRGVRGVAGSVATDDEASFSDRSEKN